MTLFLFTTLNRSSSTYPSLLKILYFFLNPSLVDHRSSPETSKCPLLQEPQKRGRIYTREFRGPEGSSRTGRYRNLWCQERRRRGLRPRVSLICHIDIYHIGACIALLVPADLAERVARSRCSRSTGRSPHRASTGSRARGRGRSRSCRCS